MTKGQYGRSDFPSLVKNKPFSDKPRSLCILPQKVGPCNKCQCGTRQAMFHIVNRCPQTSWKVAYHSFTWLKVSLFSGWCHMADNAHDNNNHPAMFLGCQSTTYVHSSGQILLPQYLMNGLSGGDEIYRECSLAPTDDLIRFWRLKVKVTSGHWGGEDICVNAGELEVCLLVLM